MRAKLNINPLKWLPTGIYLLKINNGNTRARRQVCPELTIKTLERRHLRRLFKQYVIDRACTSFRQMYKQEIEIKLIVTCLGLEKEFSSKEAIH